ncbi:MAG: PKD domain-containing protein [candidate division WOR-3 bacterium]|nr:MAG: PKD domain-containing protein [candidate division WOR-3 bacterium]
MARKAMLFLALLAALGQGEEPAKTIVVEVPAYTATEQGGIHFLDIEGGRMLNREEGRPQVPYMYRAVEYPLGHRVRKLELKEVAKPESTGNMKLPVVRLDPFPKAPVKMAKGYYPPDQFEWEVLENTDGGQVLNLLVFPVHYLPEKELVVFFPRYEFEVHHSQTTVSIADIRTSEPTYDPGEEVELVLVLSNSGAEQEVSAEALVRRSTEAEAVADLKAVKLSLGEQDTVRLVWFTAKQEPGEYEFEASVLDSRREELDRAQTWFRLGRPQAEVTGFRADPEQFKVGDGVKLELTVRNTGTCRLSGEAVFEVMAGDSLYFRSAQAFDNLATGSSKQFSETWSTEEATEGVVYDLVAFASFEGTATLAERAGVSTNAKPVASFTFEPESVGVGQEVEFDGSGSLDPDGRIEAYLWEFGDGAEARAEDVTHAYHQPGRYTVRLTVSDSGGRSTTAEQTVVVAE